MHWREILHEGMGHKTIQHVKIRRGGTTMVMGTGQEFLKRSPDEQQNRAKMVLLS